MEKNCSPFPLYKQYECESYSEFDSLFGYLHLCAVFIASIYFLELYLDLRQLNRFYNHKGIPKELHGKVTQETFDKSVAYRKDKFALKIAESAVTLIVTLSFLFGGMLPFLWDQAESFALRFNLIDVATSSPLYRESLVTWLFLNVQMLVDTIMALPFALYSTFGVEARHGFNKSTLSLFISDKLMSIALIAVISALLLPVFIYLVHAGGKSFYFYVWIFFFVVALVMMTLYPTLIAPLFNKFTPLPDSGLKRSIEGLAKHVGFPLTEIYVVDGSKRSGHSNAYFYGFFKNQRIVLYDTLLKQVGPEEVVAVLGHEIGHWKLWHTLQGFAVSQLYTFALCLAFSFFRGTVTGESFFVQSGFKVASTGSRPVVLELLVFLQSAAWMTLEKLLSYQLTAQSRRNEFAADRFALSLQKYYKSSSSEEKEPPKTENPPSKENAENGEKKEDKPLDLTSLAAPRAQFGLGASLSSALLTLSVENLDNFLPDPWYSGYHFSHPPLVERLRAIAEESKKSQ